MRGRPQPSTKAEADELEADLNAKYKEIDRPGNVQIQSLEEKNKATDVERENLLKSRTPAINSFFRLKPATMDISLGETVDSEGKPAGGAILYEGEKPLQPNNQTLDENNSVKRIDIGKSLEAYTEAVGPQPAMGRMYSAYVSAPLAERSRKLGTPVVTGEALNPKTGEMEPEYELHVELDPFEVAKQSKLGQDAVLASEANRTASFAYENYGIVPQPPPPKIVPKEYKAGELLDRVQDEIFGGGGLSPSAALSIMDQNLKPDQDDGTYSPAAQQKIQNLVNSAEKTLQEVRTTQGTIDVMSSGYLGNRGHGQRKVEAAQNVLTALQKTQQKMRTPPPGGALQAPRVPPDLKSPELQKFGGLLNLGKEPIKGKEPAAPEKQREDLPKRGGPFFGTGVGKAEPSRGSPSGVIGMRGALTLAAIGGQTEVNSFNSAFSSVQKAKDRNAAAKSAAGDLKSAWGGMTDKEKEAARSQWTTKKTQWKQWKVDEKYINEVDAFINPKKK